MRIAVGTPLLGYLLLLWALAPACFASEMNEAIRLLRDQRAVAEDLALQVKAAYSKNTPEYKEAKRLYDNARREYSRFIEELTFSIVHSELKDLRLPADKATMAAKEFERFVTTKTKTLGAPLAGVLVFGDAITKAAEVISKEVRAWFEYSDRQKKELAEDIERLLAWKDWQKIT